jgi:3-deoxy-7-phosphoheptulonate synthase
MITGVHVRQGVRVEWHDHVAVRRARDWLAVAAPVTDVQDVERLRALLSEVAKGSGLVIQGGDCAESFERNTPSYVQSQVRLLHDLAGVVHDHAERVVMIARAAGQYFKPRSEDFERTRAGEVLLKYRGDGVNSRHEHSRLRVPDALRLVSAYENSRLTVRYMTGEVTPASLTYGEEVFVSHEAMLLEYEEPLTRRVGPRDGPRYCMSTHFPWIGVRSNEPAGPHVQWARTIANPIGVKVGPHTTERSVVALAEALDPYRKPGRLTLICRLGSQQVRQRLPLHIKAVRDGGWMPVWLCDPMHGNSYTRLRDGRRTRAVEAIIEEVEGFWEVHADLGTHPGGVHLELTADEVAECVDEVEDLEQAQSPCSYLSLGDPRLNRDQSVKVMRAVRELLRVSPACGQVEAVAGG